MALFVSMASVAAGSMAEAQTAAPAGGPVRDKPNLALVSRHLQWTSAENGIKLAKLAGFPAILWTVRRGAHVDPAEVRTELPRIVKLTHDAGLGTPMIITNIGDVSSAGAEAILGTMQGLGISLYRAAAPKYQYDAPIALQYSAFRKKLAALAKLNEKYGTTAAFHTHSYGDSIGGGAWDLWMLMHDLDPRYIGLNYDIGHVMAKGGAGWRESIRAVGRFLHSCSIKDFYWEKQANVPAGQWPWRTRFVRPGDGMVNFLDFLRYLQSINFQGPLENYFEYMVDVPGQTKPFDMLGTDYGKWKLQMPEELFLSFLKRDVGFYNGVWHRAMTTPPAPSFSVKAGDSGE
jgi:sugar phosphate isomerase/epimerase